ncbi:MAG: translation initiation factor eIF-2B [Calditrichaeota bacterium]|nr:MAG: translation initiation factor eIF-2B [Calditrichota bacterium]
MSQNYLQLLEDVKSDRSSGAWVVARKAVQCMEALTKEISPENVEELVREVERVVHEILKAQPGMAQLINFFNNIFRTIEQETSDDPVKLLRKISGEAVRFDEFACQAVDRAAAYGSELINQDAIVMTHSNSSTVFEIFKKAHDDEKTFQVILTESRPMCEGRKLAEELSKLGIPSVYLIDAAIGIGIERSDIVLLGADSVSETILVNKIGTRGICLSAREAMVPCYAICESSKFIPQKLSSKKEEPRDSKEVWENPPPETTVENYYFDQVPLEFFTGIITEDGILTPAEIGGKIRAQKLSSKLIKLMK